MGPRSASGAWLTAGCSDARHGTTRRSDEFVQRLRTHEDDGPRQLDVDAFQRGCSMSSRARTTKNAHRRAVHKTTTRIPRLLTRTTGASPRLTRPVTSALLRIGRNLAAWLTPNVNRAQVRSWHPRRADRIAITMPSRNGPTRRTDAQMNDRFTIASRRHKKRTAAGETTLGRADVRITTVEPVDSGPRVCRNGEAA